MTTTTAPATRHGVRVLLAASALVAPLLVGGCASEQDRYCDALAEASPRLEQLSRQAAQRPVASTLASLPILRGLADQSPPELTDEWDTLLDALGTFERVVRRTGIETGPGAADAIADLPPAQRQAVQEAAVRLAEPAVKDAGLGIEDHGVQVCDVSLGIRGA